MKTFKQFFKTVTLVAAFFLVVMNADVNAQTPNWMWANGIGGTQSYDEGSSIATDADGNIYVVGDYATAITFGSITLPDLSNGWNNIFLVKFDASGNVLWATHATSENWNQCSGVTIDVHGNVLMTGYFLGDSITFGSTTLHNAGDEDIFVAKYDPSGNVLWAKQAGGTDLDQPNGITTDAAGNVLITGRFRSHTLSFGSTTLTNTSTNLSDDMFVVKYDSSGNALWAKKAYANNYNDEGYSIATDAENNIYVSGEYAGYPNTFDSIILSNVVGGVNTFVAKYNASGYILWVQTGINQSGYYTNNSVATDVNGNVLLTGSFMNPNITFGAFNLTNSNNNVNDIYVVKYDTSGNVLWAKSSIGTTDDYSSGITTDASGNILITGTFSSPIITFDTFTLSNPDYAQYTNIYVVKYDTSGDVIWAISPDESDAGAGSAGIACTNSGDVMITGSIIGYEVSFGMDTLINPNTGSSEILVAKLRSHPCSLITPTITPSGPTTFCQGNNVSLDAGSYSSYSWSDGETTEAITVNTTGTYTVTVTDANGCTGSASQAVTVIATNFTLPYTELFFDQDCWTIQHVSGTGDWSLDSTMSTGLTPASGQMMVFPASTAPNGTVSRLISPLLDFTGITEPVLNYHFATGNGSQQPDSVAVYISADGGTTFTFMRSALRRRNTANAWTNFAIDLAPYANTPNIKLAFDAISAGGGQDMAIDDVSLFEATCPEAVDFNSTAVTYNSATVNWHSGGGTPSDFVVRWGPSTSNLITMNQITLPGTDSTYTITGLASNTLVYWQVRADCGSATSGYPIAFQTFHTLECPSAVTITSSSGNNYLCPASSLTLTASAGFEGYTWSTTATTQSITVANAAAYSVTATNIGCTAVQASVNVIQDSAISLVSPTYFNQVNNLCNGGSNGIINVSPAGGILPYSYSWSPSGATTATISGLTAGAYAVTVTDNVGCSNTKSATIGQPSPILLGGPTHFSQQNVSPCYGNSNGSISLNPEGGTPGYSYSWSPVLGNNDTVTGLAAGTYNVTVTDANGCTKTLSSVITQPTALTPAITANGPTTFNFPGSVSLDAGTYASYLWSTGATTESITASITGNYSVTVTDGNGCTGVTGQSVSVIPPPTITFQKVYKKDVDSYGEFVSQTNDGGYMILGDRFDTTAYTNCSYFFKTDMLGNVQMSKIFLGYDNQFIAGQQCNDGGYIMCGSGSLTLNISIQVIRTNSIGDTLWTKDIGDNSDLDNAFIHQIEDGSFMVVIEKYNQYTGQDIKFFKLDTNGNLIYQLDYPGISVHSVMTTNDGGYIVGGGSLVRFDSIGNILWTNSYIINQNYMNYNCVQKTNDGGFVGCGSISDQNNGAEICVIKTDGYGNVQIAKTFGGTGQYESLPSSIQQTNDGGYVIAGTTSSFGNHQYDYYLIKTDSILNMQWSKTYGGSNGETAKSVQQTYDGGYIIVGSSESFTSDGSDVIYLVKTDSLGNSGCNQTDPQTIVTIPNVTLMPNINSTPSYANSGIGPYGPSIDTGCNEITICPCSIITPTIHSSTPTTFCQGTSDTLDAGSYSTYLWSTGASTETIIATSSGAYSVTVSDVNGCSGTASIVITVNANPTPSIIANGPTTFCNGGSVTLDAGSYSSYLWSTSDSIETITASTSNTYSVTVTDANGCTGSASQDITVNPNPTPVIIPDETLPYCNYGHLSTGAYASYLWSTNETRDTTYVGSSGTYTVTVTDDNGCMGSASYDILVIPSPTPVITGNTTICEGQTTTLDAGGPYSSYSWIYGQTTETITVSQEGLYYLDVYDSVCYGYAQIYVTVNPNPTPSIYVYGDTNFCQGGQATLDPGTFATYIWSNGNTTEYNTVTSSGNYMVTVTDNNGCTGITAQAIIVNQNPSPSIAGPSIACAGSDVTLDAGSWTSYSWNNGATTESITENTSGYYAVVVTDANGCTGNADTYLTIFDVPYTYINLNSSSALCETVTLGAYSYNQITAYSWNTGDTTQSITVTTAADYAVTITDNNGCPGTATFVVDSIPQSNVSIYVYGNPTFCQGGSVYLDPGTYTSYLWNTGDTTELINVSTSNNYVITVTNDIGCTGTASVLITVNPNPTPSITGQTSACSGSPFTLNTGTYSSYIWSDGDTTESTTTTNGGYIQVTVMDGNGCTGVASTFVTINQSPNPTIIPNGPTTFCSGGSVTLDAGSYISYNWVTGETTESITVYGSEPYCVTVSDINGCTGSVCVNVDVFANPNPVITPSGPTSFCTGSSVTLNAGNSYTNYLWSNGATTQSITATNTGIYIVTVTASGGCTSSNSITVTELPPPSPIITPNGPTTFCTGGSVTLDAGIYSAYHWSTGSTNEYLIVTTANTYKVTVTTPQGCTGVSNNVIVTISPNITGLTITGATSVCTGTNVTLSTNITYNSYLWSTGATTQSLNILATGIYYVTVSNGGNCTAVAHHSVTFQINPTPVIVPTNLSNICGGGNAILTVSSVYSTYNWSTAATTQAININSGGTYTVTVLSSNGCTGTTSLIASSGCVIPTFPAIPTTNIAVNGGMANWIEPACFYGFTLRISKHNQNIWTNYTIAPNTHYMFSGLTLNTNYDWQIQTNCNASGTINSGFSASQTFTTLLREEGNVITNPDQPDYAFNVYPNPTNDRVTVAFTAGMEDVYTIRVMDVTGRIIQSLNYTSVIGENQYQIDLSQVAKGIYMVILQNKDAVLQSKIVVQ